MLVVSYVECPKMAQSGPSLATRAMAVEHPIAGIRDRARAGDGTAGLASVLGRRVELVPPSLAQGMKYAAKCRT